MSQLRTGRPAGSPVALAAASAGLLTVCTLLLQVLTGLGAASIGGDPDVAATSAVTFRGCAVLIMVSLATAVMTARGLRAATRSTLAAVATGALVAYVVLAILSPGHVTLARLVSDAPAICLITDGVLFLAVALVGVGFSVWRNSEA
jgi:hypothetical protein